VPRRGEHGGVGSGEIGSGRRSQLVVLNADAPTIVNVVLAVDLRDRSKVVPSEPRALRINAASTGSLRIGNDAQFGGFVAAPNASIEVGSRSTVTSCIAAKKLSFQPDGRISGLN
jgi:hypothetical protein